ncbi:hypothetical protein ASG67_08685 [Sphingomonas sp. Leaf339]|uniref:hypothetical protein n=1 Tax=Sphingomonas sp. Leaf339 TaxID=1736343 RepID=UPI0006F4DD6D|nr:hypothetical protein [Sphingomonas sp. Leaf339]KQU52940.1 hypothetical protein ASG67_08685 [Sphingomonas sp. Leaf339]
MSIAILLTAFIQTATPAAMPTPTADPEKRICRTSGVTGSRLGAKKVCHTRREWDEASAVARQRMERIQNGAINTGQ